MPNQTPSRAHFGKRRIGKRAFSEREAIETGWDATLRYFGDEHDEFDLQLWLVLFGDGEGKPENHLI